MVLTSPNMDYVPEYPVESTVIDMYADGRWGDHEYSRWPQVLQPDMWHVPCIPCVPVPPEVPEILWEPLLPQSRWVEDRAIGFTGVGYIKTETRDALIAAANSAIQQCEEMGAPQRVAKYGRFLVMILRQVVDRMRYYPVVAEIAVAVAAHVQHVCLELAGLKTYIDVVAPRLASDRDHSTDVLPVLGAFVRDGTDAQNCFRVGLPTWILRPLAPDLAVWSVVECRAPSFSPAYDRSAKHQHVVGVPNSSGNWLSGMLMFVLKQVASTHLTPMSIAEVPSDSQDDDRPGKRHRREDGHVGLRMPIAAVSVSRCHNRNSKNGEANPRGVHVASAPSQCPGALSPPPGAPHLHPSKSFTLSPFYAIPPVWATALQAVSPIPRAMTSATYFYPPPFLLDTVSTIAGLQPGCAHPERARQDEKVHRYIHNFVRIREFCRARLFDVTIANEPLTIAEWRTALWGDYLVSYHPPSNTSGPSDYRRSVRRQEERKGVTRLFRNVAHFRSYCDDEVVQLGDIPVDLAVIASNVDVRLYLLWETHEVNFRAELLCLDTLMVQKPSWTFAQRIHREFFVSRVWGPPSSIMSVFPNNGPHDHPFRWFSPPEPQWIQCCDTLRSFAEVLSVWPGCPHDVCQGLPLEVSQEMFARVQVQAVDFYVRAFVKTFARLPTPPIMLPM